MIVLDVLWWVGLAWFAVWTALPLLLVPLLGTLPGAVAWLLLAPWTSLFGMALVHRLLPTSMPGSFRLFADAGAIHWALKGWAPSLYLTVFQSVYFMSERFQRTTLRAFGAQLGSRARLTSRTAIREPHHVRVGTGSLIGEYVHLVCSYQPRIGLLVVGRIDIGERVLVGAHSHVGPGACIGDDAFLEYSVRVGAHSSVGAGTRIGAGTAIYNSVRIGSGVTIGKGCLIRSGEVIPDGTLLPDGAVVRGGAW